MAGVVWHLERDLTGATLDVTDADGKRRRLRLEDPSDARALLQAIEAATPHLDDVAAYRREMEDE
jgi:hypothetical protein